MDSRAARGEWCDPRPGRRTSRERVKSMSTRAGQAPCAAAPPLGNRSSLVCCGPWSLVLGPWSLVLGPWGAEGPSPCHLSRTDPTGPHRCVLTALLLFLVGWCGLAAWGHMAAACPDRCRVRPLPALPALPCSPVAMRPPCAPGAPGVPELCAGVERSMRQRDTASVICLSPFIATHDAWGIVLMFCTQRGYGGTSAGLALIGTSTSRFGDSGCQAVPLEGRQCICSTGSALYWCRCLGYIPALPAGVDLLSLSLAMYERLCFQALHCALNVASMFFFTCGATSTGCHACIVRSKCRDSDGCEQLRSEGSSSFCWPGVHSLRRDGCTCDVHAHNPVPPFARHRPCAVRVSYRHARRHSVHARTTTCHTDHTPLACAQKAPDAGTRRWHRTRRCMERTPPCPWAWGGRWG